MFTPNEFAVMVLAGFSLVFIILMYIIICNAIDHNDNIPAKVKRRNK